jgi:hypothetical protein
MWLIVAAITLAMAIGFSILALTVQQSDAVVVGGDQTQ